MSRQVYLLGTGVALVALALAFTDWALSLRSGVTEANVRRIRVGMTVHEVEALLGGPKTGLTEPAIASFWSGESGDALVVFSKMDRVTHAWYRPSEKARPGPFARLRTWLGW
jgi:hypothetical protein